MKDPTWEITSKKGWECLAQVVEHLASKETRQNKKIKKRKEERMNK
jgi:hypothetical protein